MRDALRSRTWVILATMIAAAGALGWVQPKKKPAGGSSQSEVKKSFNAATKAVKHPKEVHDALASFVGNFDTATEVSLGSSGEPLKTHDVATSKWIMGGLFVQFNSSAAADEDLKSDRMIVYGYDTGAKKYTIWQIESGSATASSATGDFDAATKTFTFEGMAGATPVESVIHVEANGTLKKEIKKKGKSGEMRVVAKVTHTPKK